MKLFLPSAKLEEWVASEQADLNGNDLVVRENKATHAVVNAVHFAKIVSGDDVNQLVGKVKTVEQLNALKAEHMADSVILGDAAYEVVSGFIAEVAAAPTPKADPKKKAASPEADLLAAFILDKL